MFKSTRLKCFGIIIFLSIPGIFGKVGAHLYGLISCVYADAPDRNMCVCKVEMSDKILTVKGLHTCIQQHTGTYTQTPYTCKKSSLVYTLNG